MHDDDALLLDMGEYYLPHLAAVIPAAAAAQVGTGLSDSGCRIRSKVLPEPTVTNLSSAGLEAAAAALFNSSSSSSSNGIAGQLLQVYSIFPRSLAARSKQLGGQLALKEGMQQTELSYFDAPGVLQRCYKQSAQQ